MNNNKKIKLALGILYIFVIISPFIFPHIWGTKLEGGLPGALFSGLVILPFVIFPALVFSAFVLDRYYKNDNVGHRFISLMMATYILGFLSIDFDFSFESTVFSKLVNNSFILLFLIFFIFNIVFIVRSRKLNSQDFSNGSETKSNNLFPLFFLILLATFIMLALLFS